MINFRKHYNTYDTVRVSVNQLLYEYEIRVRR